MRAGTKQTTPRGLVAAVSGFGGPCTLPLRRSRCDTPAQERSRRSTCGSAPHGCACAHPAVSAGGSFNQLINSGIVHPTGVLIVPFLGAVTGSNGGLGDNQWKSPFDTCPATTSPVSLTNLQVSVGGQNVLQSTLQYGYEHFLEQVNLAEQLTSSDFGISTGLINQNYWENSKWYYVNVERGNAADKLNGRNINVSFTNNSNVPVEVMVFIFYSDEITIDVKTGLVTRHKN